MYCTYTVHVPSTYSPENTTQSLQYLAFNFKDKNCFVPSLETASLRVGYSTTVLYGTVRMYCTVPCTYGSVENWTTTDPEGPGQSRPRPQDWGATMVQLFLYRQDRIYVIGTTRTGRCRIHYASSSTVAVMKESFLLSAYFVLLRNGQHSIYIDNHLHFKPFIYFHIRHVSDLFWMWTKYFYSF